MARRSLNSLESDESLEQQMSVEFGRKDTI